MMKRRFKARRGAQAELARRAKVTRKTVNYWLNGKTTSGPIEILAVALYHELGGRK